MCIGWLMPVDYRVDPNDTDPDTDGIKDPRDR